MRASRPHPGEHPKVKRLGGHEEKLYRLRVGDYRAIIDKHLGHLRVLVVRERSTVYRDDVIQEAKRRHRQR